MASRRTSGTANVCSCCRMNLPQTMFSKRQKRLHRNNRKCSACIAADHTNLDVSWKTLTEIKKKHIDNVNVQKCVKRAKIIHRRRMELWFDSNPRIYARQEAKVFWMHEFQDNYQDHILLCHNCGRRDKEITGEEK